MGRVLSRRWWGYDVTGVCYISLRSWDLVAKMAAWTSVRSQIYKLTSRALYLF